MSVKAANYTEKFGFGRRMIWSAMIMIVLLISAIFIHVYAGHEASRLADAKRPKLNLSGIVSALRKYHKANGIFPSGLKELRASLKRNPVKNSNGNVSVAEPSPESENSHPSPIYEDKFFVEQNYLYIYYQDNQFCSVWAIPQGEYADEAQTVYLMITPLIEEKWRGPRIKNEDFGFFA